MVVTDTANIKMEDVTPMISKLLAGSSKNKRPYPIEMMEEDLSIDPNEESGILEISYEDSLEDTTSPEDPSAPKNKRTARKCKWYASQGILGKLFIVGVTTSRVDQPIFARAMEADAVAIAESWQEARLICV